MVVRMDDPVEAADADGAEFVQDAPGAEVDGDCTVAAPNDIHVATVFEQEDVGQDLSHGHDVSPSGGCVSDWSVLSMVGDYVARGWGGRGREPERGSGSSRRSLTRSPRCYRDRSWSEDQAVSRINSLGQVFSHCFEATRSRYASILVWKWSVGLTTSRNKSPNP